MITAKKAKEQIFESISEKKYIKKIETLIYCAIFEHKFRCKATIDEYDDIDTDIVTTSCRVIACLEYYGYKAIILNIDSKKCTIEISWNV